MRFMSNNFAEPVVKKYRGDNWETNGTTFFGTKGWVSLSRSTYAASNPEWFKLKQCLIDPAQILNVQRPVVNPLAPDGSGDDAHGA